VNGYRLQDDSLDSLDEARRVAMTSAGYRVEPHTSEAQALALELMNSYRYRLDTNFAKIERIDNQDIERFKAHMLATIHEGRTVSSWTRLLRDLNLEVGSAREINAARAISLIYDAL
jgi:hypothetical protein